MLKKGGVILIDNPSKDTKYNTPTGYKPNKFYFNDWKGQLKNMGFSKVKCINYKTKTKRMREITILKN